MVASEPVAQSSRETEKMARDNYKASVSNFEQIISGMQHLATESQKLKQSRHLMKFDKTIEEYEENICFLEQKVNELKDELQARSNNWASERHEMESQILKYKQISKQIILHEQKLNTKGDELKEALKKMEEYDTQDKVMKYDLVVDLNKERYEKIIQDLKAHISTLQAELQLKRESEMTLLSAATQLREENSSLKQSVKELEKCAKDSAKQAELDNKKLSEKDLLGEEVIKLRDELLYQREQNLKKDRECFEKIRRVNNLEKEVEKLVFEKQQVEEVCAELKEQLQNSKTGSPKYSSRKNTDSIYKKLGSAKPMVLKKENLNGLKSMSSSGRYAGSTHHTN
eukprot:TRINITY_DN22410_c0_g1_i2.p1 TRINITY_DN22410_c0_g1~~TRINITY_DN22410_c0_g1_i2.p1  ORF type:complete len:342 (-),score=92.62 TRINITY_DN22410_c0_g1_i2:126-1151(-)